MSCLLTHIDLDGISVIIIAKILNVKYDKIYTLNYRDIDGCDAYDKYHDITFVDLSPSEDLYDRLSKDHKVVIMDHHVSSSWCKKDSHNIHDIERCGSKIYLDWCISQGKSPSERLIDYINHVDVFDRWVQSDSRFEQALNINRYFEALDDVSKRSNSSNGWTRYISFIDAIILALKTWPSLPSGMVAVINEQIKEEEENYNKVRRDMVVHNRVAYHPFTSHHSNVMHMILERNPNIDIIGMHSRNGISFRSRDIDLTQYSWIQGHPHAAYGRCDSDYIRALRSGRISLLDAP